jgi:hypothetical protein
MKKFFLILLIACTVSSAYAVAPTITGTTVWPDTSFTGPFTVKTVITCTDGIGWPCLGFQFNPVQTGNTDPTAWYYGSWGDPNDNWVEEYIQVGDTFYFDIPTIPVGIETPVEIAYVIFAYNGGYSEYTYDPSGGTSYYSFMNTIYSPQYLYAKVLNDTFYNGPYVINADITTIFGDSIKDDIVYSDIDWNSYSRDSVGTDGHYYYNIPRFSGGQQTPITVNWFLQSFDTLNNMARYPSKGDSTFHFRLIDPMPYNTHTISDPNNTGPFPVWTNFVSEGNITADSLMLFNGSGWDSYPRDSVGTNDSTLFYYTIPEQDPAVVTPVTVSWYIKATDSLTNNFVYVPYTSPSLPYTFRIFDYEPPQISNVTYLENTIYAGPFEVKATLTDTSSIYQARLYYRIKPLGSDTVWHYQTMFPTGNPNEYHASIPAQYPGTMVQYFLAAKDGARDEGGNIIGNTSYYPAGHQITPCQFFVGDQPHRVLLVNDALQTNEYGQYYIAPMDTTGVLYGYWDNRKDNVLSQLGNFNVLVWFTGDDSLTTLTQNERDSLSSFLDRGGSLLLSSKNLGQNVTDTAVFYNSYLKADFDVNNVATTNLTSIGRVTPPISNGNCDTLAILTAGTAGNYKSVDRMFPLPGAESVYQFKTIGGSSVIRCSTDVYRVVFSSIPLETISSNTAGKLSRTEFIARSLRWFGMTAFYKVEGEPEPEIFSKVAILNQARPNPFTSNTSISYVLPNSSRVSLKIYNILGQEIVTLCDELQTAGIHEFSWNGLDDSGRKASNGIYLYRLTTENTSLTKKMVKIK